MNEASITSALRKRVLAALPGCYWQKHADRATLGVPDLSVTARGRTSWVEVKYVRKGQRASEVIAKNKVQLATMYKANVTSHDRAFYAVYSERQDGTRSTEIWLPRLALRLKDSDPLRVEAFRTDGIAYGGNETFSHALVLERLKRQHPEIQS